MTTDNKHEELQKIGRCAYESIAEMVAALECDWDRLEELRSERDCYEADWEDMVLDSPAFIGFEGTRYEIQADPGNPDGPAIVVETAEEAAKYLELDAKTWEEENPDDANELDELESAAGDCEDEDDARQRIDEDPLSLQVRSGWHSPGEEGSAEEFELLLSTGGPAVRIIGELDEHGEPTRATLQSQDWFTPWTDYLDADEDVLLTYCRNFYFGE